jgi:TonB family protein
VEAEKETPKTPEQTAEAETKAKQVRVQKAQKAVAVRAKAVEQKLRTAGVLAILSGVGGTARGPAVVDVLGKKGRLSGDVNLDKSLEGISGLTTSATALNQQLVRNRDATGGTARRAEITDLLAGLNQAKTGELTKKGDIKLYKKPDIIGEASNSAKRSQDAIHNVVKTNLASIKISYERQLKLNPALTGKVVVRFLIQEDGSVANVEIIESTMNSPELEKDIVRKIERWKFETLASGSGSITVTYPFVFQPS